MLEYLGFFKVVILDPNTLEKYLGGRWEGGRFCIPTVLSEISIVIINSNYQAQDRKAPTILVASSELAAFYHGLLSPVLGDTSPEASIYIVV